MFTPVPTARPPAVVALVAVAALPVHEPDEPVVFWFSVPTLSVTVPLVPPPVNPVPAVTPVISPVFVVYPAPFVIALLFRDILAVPLKLTPAIVLAVASLVAVTELPVQEPEEPVTVV